MTITTDAPATNGAAVLERVRAQVAAAKQDGRPRPGRPALVATTGATEHQVRQALATLAADELAAGEPAGELATDTASQPSSDLSSLSSGTASGHQPSAAGDELETPTRPPGGHLAAVPSSPSPAGDNDAPAPAPPAARRPHAWPLLLIGLAAAVAVWGGWVELGQLTGFGLVRPLPGVWDALEINTAIVLPLGMEAYGGYALRTWLSSAELSARTRRYARWSALASLVVGAGAQVASHLMRAASVTSAPPLVTILVACVPVAVLGLATGLATLVRRDASTRQPHA